MGALALPSISNIGNSVDDDDDDGSDHNNVKLTDSDGVRKVVRNCCGDGEAVRTNGKDSEDGSLLKVVYNDLDSVTSSFVHFNE